MSKYFEKISILTAILGFLFLCGTLYLIGFWTTFEFDITTYVDILDIPKSFVFPLAAALGLSALSIIYQIMIRIHPPTESKEPARPDKLYAFLTKFKVGWYVFISFIGLSTIYYFSKEAFYTLLTILLGVFIAKEVSQQIIAAGVTNVYVRWLTLIIICFLPPGSFGIGKVESISIHDNEDYFKVSHIEYMTTAGGKMEDVDFKLIGRLGSFVFLTDSLNSKIVTVNLSFVKQIEYHKVKKDVKNQSKPAINKSSPPPVTPQIDTPTKLDTTKKIDFTTKAKSMTTTLYIPSALILLNIFLTWYISYFLEKRKNRATLESIGKITTDVESIKTELSFKKDLKFSYKTLQRDAMIDFYEKTIRAISTLNLGLLNGIPFEESQLPAEIRANINEAFYQFDLSVERVNFYIDSTDLEGRIRALNILLIQYRVKVEKSLITHEMERDIIKASNETEFAKRTKYHEYRINAGNERIADLDDYKNIHSVLYDLKARFNDSILNTAN